MWNQESLEARLHLRCFNEVLERGLLVWPKSPPVKLPDLLFIC